MIEKLTGEKPFMIVFLDGNGDVNAYEEFDTREQAEATLVDDANKEDADPAILYMRLARSVRPPMVIERVADGTL